MAGVGSVLLVTDNSGLQKVRCIKIPRVIVKNRFVNGEYVIVAINKGHLKKKFSNKKVCLGLIISKKGQTRRKPGYYINFGQKRVVLLVSHEKTVGTRLYGPVSYEAKKVNATKIIKFAKAAL